MKLVRISRATGCVEGRPPRRRIARPHFHSSNGEDMATLLFGMNQSLGGCDDHPERDEAAGPALAHDQVDESVLRLTYVPA